LASGKGHSARRRKHIYKGSLRTQLHNGEEKTNTLSLSKGLCKVISKNEIEAKAEESGIHISNVEQDYVFGWLLAATPVR
jgi:hypothetical protein